MKKLGGVPFMIALLLAIALLCFGVPAAAQNLIVDGSFEANSTTGFPDQDSGTWDVYPGPTVGWWTVENTETSGNEGPPRLEVWDTLFGYPAYDGTQYVELDGYDTTTISQTPDTDFGYCYELSYAWSPRPGNLDNQIKVFIDGVEFAYHSASGVGKSTTDWTFEAIYFQAENSQTKIAFAEVGPNEPSGGTGMLFDAVSLVQCDPITVAIDIKPGSYPNCFNVNGHGVIPVAILGSADFDVTQIALDTLSFAGLSVRVKGNGLPQCSVADVSGDFTYPEGAPDGYPDLVCQFVDDPSSWQPNDGQASLSGAVNTANGLRLIQGSDSICIRPSEL